MTINFHANPDLSFSLYLIQVTQVEGSQGFGRARDRQVQGEEGERVQTAPRESKCWAIVERGQEVRGGSEEAD